VNIQGRTEINEITGMVTDLNAHNECWRRRIMTLFGSQNVKKALVIRPAVKV
jgi:hypothetical protein